MKFLNEDVRREFHSLSLDKQRAIIEFDKIKEITILYVDSTFGEVALRFDRLGGSSTSMTNPDSGS